MAAMNKVILIGNLTRDPALRYLPSQTPVASFGLAVNRKFKKQDGTHGEDVLFIDCDAFSRAADTINQYVKKGDPIVIVGRLQLESWEKDGQQRSKHKVVVEEFQFLGGKKDGGKKSDSFIGDDTGI